MNVVIPLVYSYADNIELKFSLRSMSHLIDELYIIGYCPAWLKGVRFTPLKDRPGIHHKENNIYAKMLIACEQYDHFLFANDDHFISRDFNPSVLYYSADLITKKEKSNNCYARTVDNTIALLDERFPFFDVHCPLYVNSKYFPLKIYNNTPFGYCLKTVYVATMALKEHIKTVDYTDLKITDKMPVSVLKERLFFSTGGRPTKGLIDCLTELYPEKSRFEK